MNPAGLNETSAGGDRFEDVGGVEVDQLGAELGLSQEQKFTLELRRLEIQREIKEKEMYHMIQLQKLEMEARLDIMGRTVPERQVADKIKVALPKQSPNDDIDVFLQTVENILIVNGIQREDWATLLIPQLVGKAQEAYSKLPVGDLKNYDVIKQAILDKYQLNAETYRIRFRKYRRLEGQSFKEWVNQLGNLFDNWMKMAGVEAPQPEVREILIIEQAIGQLPPDMAIFVKEKKPCSSQQLAGWADEFVLSRGGWTTWKHRSQKVHSGNNNHRSEVWNNDYGKDRGFKSKIVSDQRQCYTCHETGHIAVNCPKKQDRRETNNGVYTKPVYHCGEQVGLESTKYRDEIYQPVVVKDNDNELFRKYQCPGTVNGKPAVILRDTGCNRSLMHKKFVLSEQYLEGRYVTIRGVTGASEVFPVARIFLKCEWISLWMEVGVVPTLQVDFLLGNEIFKGPEAIDVVGVITRSKSDAMKSEKEWQNPVVEAESVSTEVKKITGKSLHVSESEVIPTDVVSGSKLTVDQQNDKSLKGIFDRVVSEEDISHQRCGFYIRDNILYRKWGPRKGDRDSNFHQIVVPVGYRKQLLRMAHDVPMSGHLGIERTKARILRNFYWPGIFSEVADYCRSCENCQKAKKGRQDVKAPLQSLPIIDVPFSRIAMDILGPLHRTRNGNKYILVVCDYSTRYPEAIPIKNQESDTIATELLKLFSRVGIPKEIVTDQGTNFMSRLIKQLCESLQIDHITSTPYHHQTNGLVERFNGTLRNMLRTTSEGEKEEWDNMLPYLLFAYREIPHESTGFSPFELLYGRPVRGPLDVIRENWEGGNVEEGNNVVCYINKMRNRMKQITNEAHINVKKAQWNQKVWYDRNARERVLEVGQRVLVLLPSARNKMDVQWQGPYKVIRKVSKVDFEIDVGKKRHNLVVYHLNLLRPWVDRSCLFASLGGETDIEMNVHEAVNVDEEDVTTAYSEDIVSFDGQKETWKNVQVSERLTPDQSADVQNLLHGFCEVFTDVPGRASGVEHSVVTFSDLPIRQRSYRLSHAKKEVVKAEIDKMLEMGIIQKSNSAWASPIVLVPKKDGSVRFCTDYRKLNQKTVFDAYPMPLIEELIDEVGIAKFMTTIDLSKGYWQIPLDIDARKKSAFITPFGLYEYKVMPFGMQNAPATFQRMMDQVLQGHSGYAKAYIDDIIIFSNTWEDHICHVQSILERLRSAGLTVKPSKCMIGGSQVPYLGYVVGNGKVQPTKVKTDAIQSFPRPITKKDVKSFLGLTGYYRRFILDFGAISCPLTDLTLKSKPNNVVWTEECEKAFASLKASLTKEPVLQSPNFNKTFVVQTDASERGLGAILSQEDENSFDHPVLYLSRKLRKHEINYSTIEKECLAVVWAIGKLHTYLDGRQFLVKTDHQPLKWLEQMKSRNNRLARWALSLQPYTFRIEYRKGQDNANADALSRI